MTVELYGPPMSTCVSWDCFSRKSIRFCSSFNKPRRSRGSRSAASKAESITSADGAEEEGLLPSIVVLDNGGGGDFALDGDALHAIVVVVVELLLLPEAGEVSEVAAAKIFTGCKDCCSFLELSASATTTFPSSPFPAESGVGINVGLSILAVADVI